MKSMPHHMVFSCRFWSIKAMLSVLLASLFFTVSCTTSAWIQDDEPVVNPESEVILQETIRFLPKDMPRPRSPELSLDIVKERELRYYEQLLSRRYIQDYKPRYGLMAAGFTGMTMGLALANTSLINSDSFSGREKVLLNMASLAIGSASLLAMKPDGDPRPADEERFIQRTGIHIVQDTIPYVPVNGDSLRYTIMRGGDTLAYRKNAVPEGEPFTIHLLEESGLQELAHSDTTGIVVQVDFRDVEQTYELSVRSIMQEYVVVRAENTAVRTAPVRITGNIIRHAGSESQFPLLRIEDEQWFRILKRGDVAYIQSDDTELLWKPAENLGFDDRIIQSGQPVFGDLDIERNVPDHRRVNPEGIALVIINGQYAGPVESKPFAERTGELARYYFSQVLGFYSDNILIYENLTEQQMLNLFENSDSLMIGGRQVSMDESDIVVYYYGHAKIGQHDRLFLLPVDYDPSERNRKMVSFDEFVTVVEQLRSRMTLVVMDTDWTTQSVFGDTLDAYVRSNEERMKEFSGSLADPGFHGGIFWAAQPTQQSGTYLSPDGRIRYPYDIFTWYFFKAMQDNSKTAREIRDYLDYNVPFTSRRLHERSQNPVYLGNTGIQIVPD
ncbi:hypothetical protein QLX67_01665 [Balneolaceae bacterium ANBcel3]|nr:hypothetical protein [Balneolaceae bacterium ANBcel3]